MTTRRDRASIETLNGGWKAWDEMSDWKQRVCASATFCEAGSRVYNFLFFIIYLFSRADSPTWVFFGFAFGCCLSTYLLTRVPYLTFRLTKITMTNSTSLGKMLTPYREFNTYVTYNFIFFICNELLFCAYVLYQEWGMCSSNKGGK